MCSTGGLQAINSSPATNIRSPTWLSGRGTGTVWLNGASYNDPRKFLQTHEYKNLTRWTKEIGERPAVKRGRMVNRTSGLPEEQLHERHDARDFETKTQDKISGRS